MNCLIWKCHSVRVLKLSIKHKSHVIHDIRGSTQSRNDAVKKIYFDNELRKSIKQYIFKNSGNEIDFQDILDRSIIAMVNNVMDGSLVELTTSINGYIFSISKNLWLAELRKRKNNPVSSGVITDDIMKGSVEGPERSFLSKEKRILVNGVLKHLGSKCKEVLYLWSHGFKMEEIAQKVGYKSKAMARKKKCLCMKELLLYIEKHPHLKEQFRP